MSIKELTGNCDFTRDVTGRSGSEIRIYRDMVLKIQKDSLEAKNELNMLRWLRGRLPVPRILDAETRNGRSLILMSRLEGEMSCSKEQMAKSDGLVRILAGALKALWAVDVSDCPGVQGLDKKLLAAEANVAMGLCDIEDSEPGTYGPGGFADPGELLCWLKANKPTEDKVLSHGDFCLPNIFIRNGAVSGYLDLGRSGVSDRYQDIALCWRSLRSNFGGAYGGEPVPGFEPDILFDRLGLTPDREKLRYYILLDELF